MLPSVRRGEHARRPSRSSPAFPLALVEDGLGVDLAVSVKFPDRDTYVCVVLAATSTGASDAVVAPAVPLDECENPPGRLGRGDFADACDLLRRDDLGLIC